MIAKNLSEAKEYVAPNHRACTTLRLFGAEAGVSKAIIAGVSHFLPGGGAGPDASPPEKVYYVLEGELHCDEGICKAGQFVWRPAGSRHEAWAGPKGGLFLAMFQIPNKFFKPGGRETDFLGNDWHQSWSHALKK